MKEGKHTKNLAKVQLDVTFHLQDIRRNVIPEFIELSMETPCWFPSEGHQHDGRKLTETSIT